MLARMRFELRRSIVADFSVGQNGAANRGEQDGGNRRSAAARSARRGYFAASLLNVWRTALTVSISEAASSNSRAREHERESPSRASHGSGSASEPKPSSEPARRYATASRTSANSASSAATSCCGASAWMARASGRTGGVAADDFFQPVEFEELFCRDGTRRPQKRIVAWLGVESRMRRTGGSAPGRLEGSADYFFFRMPSF